MCLSARADKKLGCKEVTAGYFVIEAPDSDAAVKVASGCPNVEFGSVEVREMMKLLAPMIAKQVRQEVTQLDNLKPILERA